VKASIPKRLTFSVNSAPAVRYPVGRSSFQGQFLLAFCAVGLLVGGLWIHSVAVIGKAQFFFFAVLLIVVLLAGFAWQQTETGLLSWGGESWVLTTAHMSTTGSMVVHCDVQSHMVLTLRDDQGRYAWLWVERDSDPACWRALRRAIYADRRSATGRVLQDESIEVSS
jgi:hypothetical protein